MENTLNKLAYAGIILLVSVGGCHSNNDDKPAIVHGEDFIDEPHCTSIGRIAEAQTAAGASTDGTLYDVNFHGNKLNSLGEVKLDLMRKGTDAGDPIVVYLSMPHDAALAREAAVTECLKGQGVADTRITLIEGSNLNLSTPSAYNLSNLYKADGASFNGQAAVDPGMAGGLGGAK
jgi:hypothetical protein